MRAFIVILSIILAIVLLGVPKTKPEATYELLRANGYTNITITGWRPMMGGAQDIYSTGFEATSPSGQTVRGAVTCGFMTGSTIRFE